MRQQLVRCPVCQKDILQHKEELIDTLGLDKTAREDITEEEIKKAFKEKARSAHPDRGGTTEEFQELKEAKDDLLNMINHTSKVEQPKEPRESTTPTFKEHQDFKSALRNLRTQLRPGTPCTYCKRKY